MPDSLTEHGNCPQCAGKIAKPYNGNADRTFYAVKSMTVDSNDGHVVARCTYCKTEIRMPMIKMPRQIKATKAIS